MSSSFLPPDRRFRPAGWIGTSYAPGMVRGSVEGDSFTGYNNTGVTVDDGRSEYGYHQNYGQRRRPARSIYVPRPVIPVAWQSSPWRDRDLTPVDYLRILGLSCSEWLVRSSEQKYWTVQIGLQTNDSYRTNRVVSQIDRYCTPWTYDFITGRWY